MPIYEFYCPDCHFLFNFLARSPKPDARPSCPKCARPRLERQVSRFAALGRARTPEDASDSEAASPANARMEQAIAELANRAETFDENDPRAAARLMREMSGLAGIKITEGMQEALDRLEAGEDPESIEADMGDLLNEEEPAEMNNREEKRDASLIRRGQPRRDPNLYDL